MKKCSFCGKEFGDGTGATVKFQPKHDEPYTPKTDCCPHCIPEVTSQPYNNMLRVSVDYNDTPMHCMVETFPGWST